MNENTLGKRIQSLRKGHYTQDELAKLLREKYDLKTDRSMVGKWEIGFQTPTIYTIKCIAEVFNVSIDYLTGTEKKDKLSIPVLGTVRAGIPMEAIENIIDYEEISADMARQGEFFALQIKGDSMEPKISEGDVVIVRKQSDVESGETAIIIVNGDEATIKRVVKFPGGINLVPTNPAYDVRTYSNDEIEKLPVAVLGRVVELRAKF